MGNRIFILLSMIFLHIIDDFKLQQGLLVLMKQKSWWINHHEYKEMYRYDYIVALIEHAFSWSFMIMLPISIAMRFNIGWWSISYVANTAVHAVVDSLKANAAKINLVADQTIHLAQILVTWLLFVVL